MASQLQHGYRSASEFLSREWHDYIERTIFQAGQYSDDEHRKRRMNGSIGRPYRNEIVKVLIEERGDCDKAAHKCCMNRMKMVIIVEYTHLSEFHILGQGSKSQYFSFVIKILVSVGICYYKWESLLAQLKLICF